MTRAITENKIDAADWEALRQMMGGIVKKPEAAKKWGERESRRRVREVADAIW